MRNQNYIIVLNALMAAPGERTVVLPNGVRVGWGWGSNKLYHIMYTYNDVKDIGTDESNEELWYEYPIDLNYFVELCNRMSEEDIVNLIAGTVLRKNNIKRV